MTLSCCSTNLNIAELPRDVEDLDEGQGHGDEAEHQVGDGQVHDEDVPGRAHGGVAGHHVDDHEVAHAAEDDHESVEGDEDLHPGRGNAGLQE